MPEVDSTHSPVAFSVSGELRGANVSGPRLTFLDHAYNGCDSSTRTTMISDSVCPKIIEWQAQATGNGKIDDNRHCSTFVEMTLIIL